MEPEHPGMRDGELSTMKVKSVWSPRATLRPRSASQALPGRPCIWLQVTGHAPHREVLLSAGKVETGGGGSLSGTER